MNSLLGAQAGASATTASPGFAGRVVYTLLFFVAYDFGRFVAHSLLHDVPALWAFHQVHHSAEVLTPMTAYRAHPLDLLVMAWVPALLTGLATWVFNRLSEGQVGFFTFLGLHVLLWSVNLIDNLRHSHVWVTYGPVVGRWIVSPAHHQLHHSCEPRHMGCNRGFSLAIWDRLYGSLRMPEAKPETFRMGLGDGTEAGWHSVRRMYLWPFAGCARAIRAAFGRTSRKGSSAS
jgi:sterol desaturase/sphingolipid hydroxylase (fatty acid hydroxylase superfamily)